MEPTRTLAEPTWRLGVVSYLNAKPLIAGLESDPSFDLAYDVPSRLAPRLDAGEVDAALVPVIDLVQPHRCWRVVSDACIACDGETFTVRVFSRVPPEAIRRLHVDGDSRTSVALATIIWRETHGRTLDILPFSGDETVEACEAVLLIGDKVVNNTLIDFDIQTDLGSAWKSLTGLPFVFAVWAAPRLTEVSGLGLRLARARDLGVESAELIAADYGPAMGWPVALAKRYLTTRLKFTLGPRHRLGMETFLELTKKHGLVGSAQEIVFA
jgi:chorismate dehydratase